jgi:nucleoside-diphosphate-sugar epimerase
MKNVIITGADGFVGSHTVEVFLKNGINVLAIDINDKPVRLKKHANLTYMKFDIFNEDLSKEVSFDIFDTFIHFAWIGSSGNGRMDYNLQVKNALGTVEVLKIAKKIGCNRFVCAGSIMEYEIEAVLHSQGSRPSLGYIYGMGKHLAHGLCKVIANDIGIDLIWPMITNAYGIGEDSPRFINLTLKKIINNEKLLFTSATQNYDFVYITDVAEAFYLVSNLGIPFKEYIIGSSNAKPLKEYIFEMLLSCAPDIQPNFGDISYSGTDIPLENFNTDEIKRDCGYKPKVNFSSGTKLTMEWLKSITKL